MGPPLNPAHVREWNLSELRALLTSRELPVEFLGLTRSNTESTTMQTTLAILSRVGCTGLIGHGRDGDEVTVHDGEIQIVRSRPLE